MNTNAIYELNGYLDAFARLNTGPNHSPTYRIEQLPPAGGLIESVRQHFSYYTDEVSVSPVANWRDELTAVAQRWLFTDLFGGGRLRSSIDDDTRRNSIDGFVWLVSFWLDNSVARLYTLQFVPTRFYEMFWEDFVLEADGTLFLLHWGVSD